MFVCACGHVCMCVWACVYHFKFCPPLGFCPAIQPLRNGLMVGGKKVGESMWFICRRGYMMVGPSSVYCQSNATWSDRPPECGM